MLRTIQFLQYRVNKLENQCGRSILAYQKLGLQLPLTCLSHLVIVFSLWVFFKRLSFFNNRLYELVKHVNSL